MNNNKKIIAAIAVLIILILSVIIFNKRAPEVMTTDEVATTTDAVASTSGKMAVDNTIKPSTSVNESAGNNEYKNGTYWGVVKKSAIANGKLILTIDFLQSFSTKKETVIAAIQDDVCPIPSNMGLKTKQEFVAKIMSLGENEIEAFIAKTSCFKNGITYLRNSNTQLVSRDMAANFIAYYPPATQGGVSNTGNIDVLNKILTSQGPANPQWQITIKDSKIVSMNQPVRP